MGTVNLGIAQQHIDRLNKRIRFHTGMENPKEAIRCLLFFLPSKEISF